jgi:hypothetical protein
MLLLFGLVLAPLVHRIDHGHGHTHGPTTPTKTPHGTGSLEHLDALGHQAPVMQAPTLVALRVSCAKPTPPGAPTLEPRPSVACPQGP